MVVTKDNCFIRILEVLPVSIYFKSVGNRQTIISTYAAHLEIVSDSLQLEARTASADTVECVERMRRHTERRGNAAYREMIEGNIREIGQGVASEAIHRRFSLAFQYEAQMKAEQSIACSVIQRLNEEVDTAWHYLDPYELEVLEPRYSDNSILKLLCEVINKETSRQLQLSEGVFNMTTTVHGIYEDG